jgi:hypothetical protein
MIIVSDHNARGAVNTLRRLIEYEWGQQVAGLDLDFRQLEDLGLRADSTDAEIYAKCLEVEAILVTGDKTTDDGPESLENVIVRSVREDSYPVITINQARVRRDADYQSECAFNLIECLSRIDDFRGTRRIFLPFSFSGGSR